MSRLHHVFSTNKLSGYPNNPSASRLPSTRVTNSAFIMVIRFYAMSQLILFAQSPVKLVIRDLRPLTCCLSFLKLFSRIVWPFLAFFLIIPLLISTIVVKNAILVSYLRNWPFLKLLMNKSSLFGPMKPCFSFMRLFSQSSKMRPRKRVKLCFTHLMLYDTNYDLKKVGFYFLGDSTCIFWVKKLSCFLLQNRSSGNNVQKCVLSKRIELIETRELGSKKYFLWKKVSS